MKRLQKRLLSLCLAAVMLTATACSNNKQTADESTGSDFTQESTISGGTETNENETPETEAPNTMEAVSTEFDTQKATEPETTEAVSTEINSTETDDTSSSTESASSETVSTSTEGTPSETVTPEVTEPDLSETATSVQPTEPETQKPTTPETQKPTEPEMQKPTEPETQKPTEPESDYPEISISQLAAQYGFTIGGAIGNAQMSDTTYKNMISSNFGSVTATNELKAYSLLDQWQSQNSANGMPVMNYTTADKIVAWARDNGLGVRGHVLVWDAYMTNWFFREGYRWDGAYVDQETMKARLEYYINDVITHFETKFPGTVYCWDVVNEAVGDGTADYNANDPCHIRLYRNGEENPFYRYVGSDYVQLSFLYAKNTVDRLGANIKLFYNDYNTFYQNKREAICNLIESINTYATDEKGNARKLCDGVGMQGYIGGYGSQNGCMNDYDITLIKEAILRYDSLDIEVQITEMAIRNYNSDTSTMKRHAEFYANLFKMLKSVNSTTGGALTNVTIWGLCDNPSLPVSDYSYSMNGPYCGLFDKNCKPKDAFYQVYDVLREN